MRVRRVVKPAFLVACASDVPFCVLTASSGMDGVGSLDTPSEWIEVVEMEGDGVVVLRGLEGRLRGSSSPFMFAVVSVLKEIF